jgi:RNase P subunit RPR2
MEGERRHFELWTEADEPVKLERDAFCVHCEETLKAGTMAHVEIDADPMYDAEGNLTVFEVRTVTCEPCNWE